MMRLVLVAVLGSLVACAAPRDRTPPPSVARETGETKPPPSAPGHDAALARFPGSEGQTTLECTELCAGAERVPACPGAVREGQGSMAVRGLAGKHVVAHGEAGTFEPREVDGVKLWDALPAGRISITVSEPTRKVDAEYACLPVRASQRVDYDVGTLTSVHPEPPDCRGGTGKLTGNMSTFEYRAEPFERAVAIGPGGCARDLVVSSYGTFVADGLPPGTYLVKGRLDDVGLEVEVTADATAKVDLQPLEDELERRVQRRVACGCPPSYLRK